MSLTLNNCMERINQALDYPSVEYSDVSHYFDQAISELNSTLRIGLRPISQLLANIKFDFNTTPNKVVLNTPPVGASAAIVAYTDSVTAGNASYYYDTSKQLFGIRNTDGTYTYYNKIYGCTVSNVSKIYVSVAYSADLVVWVEYNSNPLARLDLTDYLPTDVIILFVIPYVCFKYLVRDGGNGLLFKEEFTQGFQQIQTSYDVPNVVQLSKVAGKKAYVEDVLENLDDLTKYVTTRAIYDDMKIGNAIEPVYGNVYDKGGWGI